MFPLTTAIVIFDDVEVLDFAGPFEVFSRTRTEPGVASRRSEDAAPFRVLTVSPGGKAVRAVGGLRVTPDTSFAEAPEIDLLVVPGGFGTRQLLEDDGALAWIGERARAARIATSVCTGSLLYAKLGLLAGKRATTHFSALDLLAELDPSIDVARGERVVHDGLYTSAGVSAGIDMAFQVVEDLCGREVADETAAYIEYRRPDRVA